MHGLLAALLLLPGWGRFPDYKLHDTTETEEADGSEALEPIDTLTDDELKMLYRQGLSECRGLGDARDDCVKGVTSVVFARIVLDQKMGGTWSLSDGTIWGTMSIYSNGFPQFSPWVWDIEYCARNGYDAVGCLDGYDLAPYFTPVRAAVNGDGGTCAGFLFYGHEPPPNPDEACVIAGNQQIMFFHNGWGWNDILKPGEWMDWFNEDE